MNIIEEKDFTQKPQQTIELHRGGLWEENKIEVQKDVPIYHADLCNCPHLEEKYIVRTYRSDNTFFDTIYANCPTVIVAVNEGGYNSTGVCYQCITEQI